MLPSWPQTPGSGEYLAGESGDIATVISFTFISYRNVGIGRSTMSGGHLNTGGQEYWGPGVTFVTYLIQVVTWCD